MYKMNKTTKQEWLKLKTIAYYSGFGGIEIKHIFSYDVVVYVAGAWSGKKTVHRVKLYHTQKDVYFKHKGIRIKFSECIRA